MNRKTLYALIAFLVLGGGAYYALRAPEKGERSGPHEPPKGVSAVSAATLDELEVTSNKEKTQLKKEGGKWMVVAPVHYPADADAVKSAVEKLEKLAWGEVVSQQKDRQKELEVDDDKGVHVVAKQGGKTVADVVFGKDVSGYTMARPAGSDEIWQTSGMARFVIAKDTKGWRDKVITDFKRDDITTIAVEAAGKGKIVFKRIPADKDKKTQEQFEVTSSPVKIEKLDDSVPQGIASAVYSLRAVDFADAAKPEETGLDKADYTITPEAGGKSYPILIGKPKGDNYYVKTPGSAQVFLVPKWSAERLAKPPLEFRDKTLCDLKADDVVGIDIAQAGTEVQLERSGSEWKAKKGVPALDPQKALQVAQAFSGFRAASFAETADPKTTGLGKPTGKVTIRSKDKKATTLLIGAKKGDQDYYMQVAGRPDIYLVKKYTVDRILKKPDELKKADATAKKS
jgi:hypothetical protein